MADKIRVGVLGLTHDHIWENLKALDTYTDGELVAVAEPHPTPRERARSAGIEKVYDDYSDMLDGEKLDAVYVYSDNLRGADLAEDAAARGLHVMVEKPMAATYAGAARMNGAAKAAGVQLMVNWPIMWWASLQEAFRMIAEGRIGQVWQVNYRSAHGGPSAIGHASYFEEWLFDPRRNGAGALMDYCCYGAALTCHLLGLPSRVTAVSGRLFKANLPAEDNAVMVMQHARAISTSTASWTQAGHLTSYEPMIYGSDGTIVIRNMGRELWLANAEHDSGVQLEVPELPSGMRTSAEYFLGHIRSGAPIGGLCGADVGLMAQEVLEAGIIAAAEGRSISLPLPAAALV